MMTETPAYNLYQQHLDQYLRCRTRGLFEEALKELDAAIEHCPVREALPTLGQMRRETEQRIPRKWNLDRLMRAIS